MDAIAGSAEMKDRELDQSESFQKIITLNDQSYEQIIHCVTKLLYFMFFENENKNVEYFRLRLKDSERAPFAAKDLLMEWTCYKEPK